MRGQIFIIIMGLLILSGCSYFERKRGEAAQAWGVYHVLEGEAAVQRAWAHCMGNNPKSASALSVTCGPSPTAPVTEERKPNEKPMITVLPEMSAFPLLPF